MKRQQRLFICWLASLFAFLCILHGKQAVSSELDEADIREVIGRMQKPIKDVPLPWIIETLSGYRVVPWSGESKEDLFAVAAAVVDSTSREYVQSKRVNEVGQGMEKVLRRILQEHGFIAETPLTPSGKRKAVGYPDLYVERGDEKFYIEVKTYHERNVNTTQRSFYLSPSTDFKVTCDAIHLLVAFQMERLENGKGYTAKQYRIVDLSNLKCDLKYEFNASNRDLYQEANGDTSGNSGRKDVVKEQ